MRQLVVGILVLTAGLLLTVPAQSWRRPSDLAVSSPDGGLFQACRDGIRFQVATGSSSPNDPRPTAPLDSRDFTVYSPPPNPDGTGGTIVAQGTVTTRLVQPVVFRLGRSGFQSFFNYLGTHAQRYSGGQLLAPGSQVQLDVGSASDTLGPHIIEDCFLFPLPSTARMVGKGTVSGGGQTASYAYILNCGDLPRTGAPFEVRVGARRFRLTTAHGAGCANYSNVATPRAGFDTQAGLATGTLDGTPGATLEWSFVDGGAGGANDSVSLTLTDANGVVVVDGLTAPPGPFPGSSQPTGFNTAQAP